MCITAHAIKPLFKVAIYVRSYSTNELFSSHSSSFNLHLKVSKTRCKEINLHFRLYSVRLQLNMILDRLMNNCYKFTFNLVIYNKDLWFDLDVYQLQQCMTVHFVICILSYISPVTKYAETNPAHFYLLHFFGETVREGVYRSILFLTKKLHLILFWQNILFYPVFIWGWIVTCHAQNVFPDTWSNVFHLKSSRLFDENNPFYGNAALFEKSKNTSRKTVIIERLLYLSRQLTTMQCLKAHVNFLIIDFFSKWN